MKTKYCSDCKKDYVGMGTINVIPCAKHSQPHHTPTPLDRIRSMSVIGTITVNGLIGILESKRVHQDTKDYIVNAINAHEELLTALQYAQNHLEKLEGDGIEVNKNVMDMIKAARRSAEL